MTLIAYLLIATSAKTSPHVVKPQIVIDRVRRHWRLPAIGLAIVRLNCEPEIYVSGHRVAGGHERVQLGDTWHLGSDTKSFTAALIAILVSQGKVGFDSSISKTLNLEKADPSRASTTIADLLDMRGDLPADPPRGWFWYQALAGTNAQRRQTIAVDAFKTPAKTADPGKFSYSNVGYVILGHVAEVLTGSDYEPTVRHMLLDPLGLSSAGFGPNPSHEPGPHINARPIKWPYADNPPVTQSAGGLHISLLDWAKWARQVMLCVRGEPSLLPEIYGRRIRDADYDEQGHYVNGWIKLRRMWSRGPLLAHAGSNTMNFSSAWLAPTEGVAYLVVTNDGGKNAASALDEVITRVVDRPWRALGKQPR